MSRRLRNAHRAIIEPGKLRDYLLNREHPFGRFKAAFFEAMGYRRDDWQVLEQDIRRQHLTQPAILAGETPFGQKYAITAPLVGPSGRQQEVTTIWIVLHGSEVPRLVTMYPARRPVG